MKWYPENQKHIETIATLVPCVKKSPPTTSSLPLCLCPDGQMDSGQQDWSPLVLVVKGADPWSDH